VTEIEFLIPFYGRPDYLFGAVDRIRALRDTRWRLTIVEDRYPDGPEVQREIEGIHDSRIRYVRNKETLGVNGNTYKCIELAEWDYFAMPGHDDLLSPGYGQAVGELLARCPDASIVQPGVAVIDGDGDPHYPLADRVKSWVSAARGREVTLRGEGGVASLLRGNWLYTPACCYRREAMQQVPFRPDIDAAHDLAFVIDVLMNGGAACVGIEPAFEYRRHSSSHSSSFARTGVRFDQERRYYADIAQECRQRGWRRAEQAARLRLTSRLNALSQAPQALRTRDLTALRTVLRHASR
jgi:hypothetical protein